MKWLIGKVLMEHVPVIREVTEREITPEAGDEVKVLMRGYVEHTFTDGEIKVGGLEPIEIVEVTRPPR